MSEEKKTPCGFRIKWADREIEYHGDSALEVFRTVFEYVKSVPTTYIPAIQPPIQSPTSEPVKPFMAPIVGSEFSRIALDSKVAIEQISKIIELRKDAKYQTPAPFLPKHPKEEEAALLVSYVLQVELQQTPIDVSYLKDLLQDPNGYQLPGRAFGLLLQDMRDTKHWILASQAKKGRNKPFSLSEQGLEEARNLLKEIST
jgi:hypothetical protein